MPWLRNHAVLNDPDGLSESVPVEFAPVESEVAKAALAISDSTGANSMGAGADGENPSGHPVDRPPRSANRPPQSTFVGDRLPPCPIDITTELVKSGALATWAPSASAYFHSSGCSW